MTIIVTNGYFLKDTQSCFSLLGKADIGYFNMVTEYLFWVYYRALYQAVVCDVNIL